MNNTEVRKMLEGHCLIKFNYNPFSRKSNKDITYNRHSIIYALHRLNGFTQVSITEITDRDHSLVSTMCKKMDSNMNVRRTENVRYWDRVIKSYLSEQIIEKSEVVDLFNRFSDYMTQGEKRLVGKIKAKLFEK